MEVNRLTRCKTIERKEMRKLFAALLIAGTLFVAAPAVAQAQEPVHAPTLVAASCVNTSFWGRAFSFFFLPTSYTAYLWQVKC